MTAPPRWKALHAAAIALLLAGCGATTWSAALDDARREAPLDVLAGGDGSHAGDVLAIVRAAELELLVGADLVTAVRLADHALSRAADGSEAQARAALLAVAAHRLSGDYGRIVPVLAGTMAKVVDPVVAETLVRAAGLVWGRTPQARRRPELLVALRAVAERRGARWEAARSEARQQLLTAADIVPELVDRGEAVRRSGLVTHWRLSAPWGSGGGAAPYLDVDEALGPETRRLRDREPTTNGFATNEAPTWVRTFSDGEVTFAGLMGRTGGVGFAEAWVQLPSEASDRRVVVRLDTSRVAALFVGDQQVARVASTTAGGPRQVGVGLELPQGPVRLLLKLGSGDGKGFARVQVSHLEGAVDLTEVEADAQASARLRRAVRSFAVVGGAVAALPRSFSPGAGAAAVRSLHLLEMLYHPPLVDIDAAHALLETLEAALPAFPGLAMGRARLMGADSSASLRARSSVMRQALERVIAAWPTHKPARRMLARLEREEERWEAALDHLREAQTGRPNDPQLLTDLAWIYRKRGWEAEAVAVAEQLDELADAGSAAWIEALQVYRSFGRAEAARKLAERLGERFPIASVEQVAETLVARGKHREAGERLIRAWKARPEDVSLAQKAIVVLRAAGHLKSARAALAELDAARPGDPWVLGQAVMLALQGGDEEAAQTALTRAIDERPGSLDLAVAQAWLQDAAAPLTSSLVDGMTLARAWSKLPAERVAGLAPYPYVTLRDALHTRLGADGSVLSLVHVVRRIQSKEGADRLGEIRPPAGARIMVVRTIRPDGTTLWPERVPGKPDLSFSGLQPGDIVEHAWLVPDRVRVSEGGYLTGLSFASWDTPTLAKVVSVSVPAGVLLHRRGFHGASLGTERTGKLGRRTYSWNLTDLAAVAREPFAAGARTFFPFVDLTVTPADRPGLDDASAWAAIAASYASTLLRATRVGPRTRAVAAQLRKLSDPGTLGLAWAAFDWVKQELNRTEEYNAFTTPAEGALASQKGNRVVVLMALLKALDLPAEVLLCTPRPDGAAADVARPLPNANRFWYPVLRIPDPAGDTTAYADPDRPYHPFGVLPDHLYGARCLRLSNARTAKSEAERFTSLPGRGAYQGTPVRWDFELDLTLQPDGTAKGRLAAQAFGPAVSGLRHVYLSTDDARRRLLWQQWTASILPGAQVGEATVQNARDSDKLLTWSYDVTVPGYARVEGDGLVVGRLAPPLVGQYLAAVPALAELVALPDRHTPLRVPSHAERSRVILRAPPGARLLPLAATVTVEEPLATIRQRVSQANGSVTIERELELRPGRVEPAAYPTFRAALSKALNALGQGVRVER